MRPLRGLIWVLASAATVAISVALVLSGLVDMPMRGHNWLGNLRAVLGSRRQRTTSAASAGASAMSSLRYDAPGEVQAVGKHTATVFMMHGLGDSAQGWLPVGMQLKQQLPHIKWIFPNAPTRPISVNMGMRMPGWYDIYELGPGSMDRQEDSAGVHESGRYLKELVDKEVAAGTPAERIVVGGFSQGGAIALYSLRYPLKLAGVVGLSTYLPLRNEGAILSSEAAGTPVFMGHGTQDELIPLSWGQTSGDLLQDKGAAVELKSYPMGHSASETELQDLTRFLRRVLP